jgi:hypothetical protein
MGSEVITSVVAGGRIGSVVGTSGTEVITVGSEVITFVVVGSGGSEVGMSGLEVIAVGSEVTASVVVGGRSCLAKFATDVISAGLGVTITTVV